MKYVVSKGCLRASGGSEAPDFQGCSGPHCHLLKSLGYTGTTRGTLKWPVSLSEGLQLLPDYLYIHLPVLIACTGHGSLLAPLGF